MARGGKIACNRESRNNVKLGKKDSDGSDEDYTVGEDEELIESEDEDYSLDEDESDDGFLEFVDDEVENRVKKKVVKPARGKGSHGRRNNGAPKPRKKKVSDSEGEDYSDNSSRPKPKRKNTASRQIDYDDEFLDEHERNGFDVERARKRNKLSCAEKYVRDYSEKPGIRAEVSYQEEEEEDVDYDESDEDDDEEFTPDEVYVIDEEDVLVTKTNRAEKLCIQEAKMCKWEKRKKNIKVLKKAARKKPKSEKGSRRNSRPDHGEFRSENQVSVKRKMIPKPIQGRRRKPRVNSDPDFSSSGLSDYEYTVSEEEREQIREASDFCGRLTSGLRNLNSLKMIEEEEMLHVRRKCPGRKGKEKVVDLKIVVGKQVCGICLSEEGKRTVRGVLNCCSHYFCFACIMEWSKVESRCPLCKQRFTTLCRTFREDGGHNLRDSAIQVPQRDQVYQPSEEELRTFLDPYENVLCTECLQGGDDALMLLCDVCDSPAHSYCVGLGREVPDGNWYCDGCRPAALASILAQPLSSTPDPGANHVLPVVSSLVTSVRETFDLNELYVPETPSSQVAGHSPSPRQSIGDSQAASPGSGSGAFTLLERRRILRQIQSFRSRNRQLDSNNRAPPASTISLFGSQISSDGSIAPQQMVTSSRMAPPNVLQQTRLLDNAPSSLYRREIISPRLRGQVLYQASTSINPSYGLSRGEFVGINTRIGRDLGREQLHHTGTDSSLSAFPFREA